MRSRSSSIGEVDTNAARIFVPFEKENRSPGDYTIQYKGQNATQTISLLEKSSKALLKKRQKGLTSLEADKKSAEERKSTLESLVASQPNTKAKHADRVGIANMATGFTIGGFLTFLYSIVEKFKAGPSPVPPPFNFIIFPVLGILGLVAAGLSIAQAVMNPTRANKVNAVFSTGDGLITAGIIAASLALPAVIIPIIPYVFIGVMGIQLAKKLFEAGKAIYRYVHEKDPQTKSGLKEAIAMHLTGATSFGLGITSVGVVMLFAHFALAPIGIAAGVFLSGFMGVLMAKTLYDKHKKAKQVAEANIELNGDLSDNNINLMEEKITTKNKMITTMVNDVQAELDAAYQVEMAPPASETEQISALMVQNTVLRNENDALKEAAKALTNSNLGLHSAPQRTENEVKKTVTSTHQRTKSFG